MKKLQPTTQYKKDYKKYRNNPKKVEALKEALKGDDIEKIKSAQGDLTSSAQKIGEALYSQQNAQDAAGAAGSAASAGADDDVVDAQVVDEEKDKKEDK